MQDPLYPTAKNEYEVLDDGTVRMDVGNGRFALLDLADLPLVAPYRWHSKKGGHTFYAGNNKRLPNNKGLTTLMHRVILGLPHGRNPMVDHINHDGLDNRRSNLRLATRSQNSSNRRRKAIDLMCPTGYLGLNYMPTARGKDMWQVRIRDNGRHVYIGVFASIEEAARAYDAKAKEIHGEFATLNFPEEESYP